MRAGWEESDAELGGDSRVEISEGVEIMGREEAVEKSVFVLGGGEWPCGEGDGDADMVSVDRVGGEV